MNIKNARNIYFVGIKGVGMTALAVYLKEQGHTVWGSDAEEVFPTDAVLSKNGIRIVSVFKKENITDTIDLVITTGAHGGLSNIEVIEARRKTITVQTLAEYVGAESKKYKTVIAVCGTHGKTTTSAMGAYVFNKLGFKSSHLVGASKFSGLNGGHFGGYDYLVVEADEYVSSPGIDSTPRFMYLDPDIIICTNIDYDHPDVYPSIEEMEKAYRDFFGKLDKEKGMLIYCDEDKRLVKIVAKNEIKQRFPYRVSDLATPGDPIPTSPWLFGASREPRGSQRSFHKLSSQSPPGSIRLIIPGRHNLLNSLAVLTLTDILGFDSNIAIKYLSSFSGSSRRFEKIYEENGVILYDDYAHHPKEIEATIAAAGEQYPNCRLIILFQPHTYSRTQEFHTEFVTALHRADKAFITDIFGSAREVQGQISSQNLQQEAEKRGITNVIYCPSDKIKARLADDIKRGDLIITMGAGSIYQAHSDIIHVMKHVA